MAASSTMGHGDRRGGDDAARCAGLRLVAAGDAGEESRLAADDELLHTFLGGDEWAFGELFRLHAPVVLAIVRRYAGGPEEARDLTQRAFLKALEAVRRDLGHQGGIAFRPWLIRIAVNLAKNHVRDAARRQKASLAAAAELQAATPPSPDGAIDRDRRARRMRLAVLQLPRRQREVVTLRLDADLSFAEIGEAIGITENNAKVHFHHAAKRLRELLAGSEGEP
jgi:RNA polymerase sigma-70 factor (ECF subfamily)